MTDYDRMRPLTPLQCRACGKDNAAHTNAGASLNVPHDGDFTLCLYCGEWSVFEGGALREPTPDEAALIAADPACIRASVVRRAVMSKRT